MMVFRKDVSKEDLAVVSLEVRGPLAFVDFNHNTPFRLEWFAGEKGDLGGEGVKKNRSLLRSNPEEVVLNPIRASSTARGRLGEGALQRSFRL